jgi:O-antigen ligase
LLVFVLLAATTLMGFSPDLRLARYMSFAYAVVIGMGLYLTRASLPAGLCFIWTALVCWWHQSTPILFPLAVVLYGVGLIYISGSSFFVPRSLFNEAPSTKHQARVGVIYNAVCIIAMLNVLWQVLQLAGVPTIPNPLITTGRGSLIGLQGNMNEVSALLAVCLPAFFRRRWAWLIPIPVAGLVMAESLGGVLAATAIAALFVYDRRPQTADRRRPSAVGRRYRTYPVIALLIVAIAAFAVFRDHFSLQQQRSTRLLAWEKSIAAALHKPVLGWGFGQYSAVIPLLVSPHLIPPGARQIFYADVEDKKGLIDVAMRWSKGDPAYFLNGSAKEVYLEAHNEYVEMLFAAGIPGLLLLLWAIVDLLRRSFRVPGSGFRVLTRNSQLATRNGIPFYGLLASCITALVFFSWQIVPIAAVTVVWAGLCLSHESGGDSRLGRAHYEQ